MCYFAMILKYCTMRILVLFLFVISVNLGFSQSVTFEPVNPTCVTNFYNGQITITVTGMDEGDEILFFIMRLDAPIPETITKTEHTHTFEELAPAKYIVYASYNGNPIGGDVPTIELVKIPYFATTQPLKGSGCADQAVGIASVNVTGGVADYSYSWNDGLAGLPDNNTITNIASGTYWVQVTDNVGCIIQSDTTTIVPEFVEISEVSKTNVLCKGQATGDLQVSAQNGTGLFTFDWSDGFVGNRHTSLPAGSYYVVATDEIGCDDTLYFSITEPAEKITITPGPKKDLLCKDTPMGEAAFTTAHGNNPLTYIWSDGGSGASRTDLLAGTFMVIVEDNTLCRDTAYVNLTEPDSHIVGALDAFTEPLCFGDANGTAEISSIGGTLPHRYVWSDNPLDTVTTLTRSDLVSMIYQIEFFDENNCVHVVPFDLGQPDTLIAQIVSPDDSPAPDRVLCFEDRNIPVKVAVSGGTAPIASYIWSSSTHPVPHVSSVTLGAGDFSVEITDAHGCKASDSHSITQPDAIVNTPLILNEILCNGLTGRLATATLPREQLGGTGNFSFEWSNGSSSNLSGEVFAGMHWVLMTDENACKDTAYISISEPDTITLAIFIESDVCKDVSKGSLWVVATGGTVSDDYSYTWQPTGETTDTITNLSPQIYTVTVRDDNNCMVQASSDLSTVNDLHIVFSMSPVFCPGGSNGSVIATPVNGAEPYLYDWFVKGDDVPFAHTATISDVTAGTYELVVTDANGCPIEDEITVTTLPAMYVQNSGITETPCNEAMGSAYIEVASGAAPYSYIWSNGETTDSIFNLSVDYYSVTVTDANGCAITRQFYVNDTSSLSVQAVSDNLKIRCAGRADGSATALASLGTGEYTYEWSHGPTIQSVSDLAAGKYFVYVRDEYNCVAVDSIVFVEEDVLEAFISNSAMVQCNGQANGFAVVSARGGVAPFIYEWENHTVGMSLFPGLIAGTYKAKVTDANSCIDSVEITITQPDVLSTIIDNTTSVSCGGKCDAEARVTVNGGTAPYSYLWSSPDIHATATQLCVGWQFVTVTDAHGCSSKDSVDIVDTIPRIALDATMLEPGCITPEGKIEVLASGGIAPYIYQWAHGPTVTLLEDLLPGVYPIQITDSKGCILDTLLVLNDNSDISIDALVRQPITFCEPCNESYQVIVSGGQAPYSYLWSNGDVTDVADSLCTNLYSVTVTDDNGCMRSAVLNVVETPISISLVEQSDIICFGDNTGILEVVASQGISSNYTYEWSNNESGVRITDLFAGTYTVTVTEELSVCPAQKTFTVIQFPELQRFFITDIPSYCKDSTGEIHVEVLNPVEPMMYVWETGDVGYKLTHAWPDYIGITITDGNGCVVLDSAKVDDVSNFSLFERNRGLISCIGDSDGWLEVGKNNGFSPFTYVWDHDPLAVEQRATGLAQGIYSVTVTDAKNCEVSYIFNQLSNPDTIRFTFAETKPIPCFNETGDVRAFVSGGHPGYSFTWTLDDVEQASKTLDLTNIPTGNIRVHVTDSRMCESDTASYFLSEPPQIIAHFTVQETGCGTQSATGSIRVDNIIGSNPPYNFFWHDAPSTPIVYDGATNILKTGLSAGTYVFRVEDAAGVCSNEFTNYTHPLVVDEINVGITHTHCNFYTDTEIAANKPSGRILVTEITTKKGDYANMANYVTVSDFSEYTITWNDVNQQSGNDATHLTEGQYSVTLTHTNGCVNIFDAGTVDALVNLSSRIAVYNESIFDVASVCLGDSLRLEAYAGIDYTNANSPASESIHYNWNMLTENKPARLTNKSANTIWARPLTQFYADRTLITMYFEMDGCTSPTTDFEISHFDSLGFHLEIIDVFDSYLGEDSVFAIRNEHFLINPIQVPWYVNKTAGQDGIFSIQWSSLNGDKTGPGHLADTLTNEASFVQSGYYGLYIPAKELTYYYATATTTNGCIEKASVVVNVYDNTFTPNYISPNGDGYNDTWIIPYLYMCEKAQVTIFNRWGVKVFENDGPYYLNPWDGTNKNGKLLPMSAYYFIIEYNDKHKTPPQAGTVSILY